ncbi:MAG: stage II sporulation protein R [Ruminococcus sp.]|nr:stage II sporulation protein R [Ruminococcus sp.]
MKLFLKSLCVGFVISILFTFVPFEGECKEISDSVFRVHILANSDSKQDQALKLKVRDAVIAHGETLLSDVHSKDEAMEIVSKNIDDFVSVAEQVVIDEGFDYEVTALIDKVWFDTRYYGDITMPSGVYDALRICIGKAQGKNWWCVMYPSLCLYAASDTDSLDKSLTAPQYRILSSDGKYEFRLKIVEVFSRVCSCFSD